MDKKIVIGKIVNTFGLKGELKVVPLIDVSFFKSLVEFEIEGFSEKFKCNRARINGQNIFLSIDSFDDINKVLIFKGHDILVPKNSLNLMQNQYLVEDIVGSAIFHKDEEIGKVVSLENYGATDILVFDQNNKEYRIPMVDQYIEKIDINSKRVYLTDDYMEGVV